MKTTHLTASLLSLVLASTASAQWQTTNYTLHGGMNAIYLTGDATHDTIDNLLPNTGVTANITEIWRWNPNPNQVQFIESPLIPSAGTSEWSVWKRGLSAESTLTRLTGQASYLVKCTGALANTYTPIQIKQAPRPPSSVWVRNGANLLGFPSRLNGAVYPGFSSYFATFPIAVAPGTKIYKYPGGPLGPANPLQILSPATEPLDRTQAYWFSSEVVGNFYAPMEVSLSVNAGLAFGRTGSVITVRVRNRTAAAVDLTFTQADSEPAPAGQQGVTGRVPLTRRIYNATTGLWPETPIATGGSFVETIGPNATVELSFGINRGDTSMTGATAGAAFFASFLRLTDSGNLMDIYLPASAQKASLAGLWIGDVSVTNVGNKVTNPAMAAATVAGGIVTELKIDGSGGYGYETAPLVTIAPPPASVPAAATATRTGAVVTAITLSNRGSGYVTAPTVTIAPPTTGTPATATATILGGVVNTVTIVSGGTGYTTDPVITFTAPPSAGTPATATATVAGGSVTQLTITAGGSKYAIGSPKVTIAPPPPLTGTTTPRPFKLRTLLHVPDTGSPALLSQVFLGQLAANPFPVGVCTLETLLKPEAKATAQRFVAAHLPLNQVITTGTGSVAVPGALTRTIQVPFDDATNPFEHQYHPDHDNRDARFAPVAAGVESYDIKRSCTFTFTAAPPAGSTVTSGWGSTIIGGTYTETITGIHNQTLQVDGTFELRRASEIGVLTQ